MIKQNSREKLINAIMYFSSNTDHCYKTKLYQLLYHLDFEHYRACGRNVTGLEYFAWPRGPVPLELHDDINSRRQSEEEHLYPGIKISERTSHDNRVRIEFTSEKEFDSSVFTKRELKLLNRIAKENRSLHANKMIEGTHLENLPWYQVYEVEGRRQELIPYSYAAKKDEFEIMQQVAKEREEFLENYRGAGNGSVR